MSRKNSLHLINAFLLLLLASCSNQPPPSPTYAPITTDPVIIQSGDDNLLHELTLRILAPPPIIVEQFSSKPLLMLVGSLPDNLPFELPLPENTTVIGALVQTDGPVGTRVFLDVNQPMPDVIDFYTQELEAQGFSIWEPNYAPTFVPEGKQLLFCNNDKKVQVVVQALEIADEPTDVRLSFVTDSRFVSCETGPNDMTGYAQSLVPTLTLPSGAIMSGSGSGSSYDGRAQSDMQILSSLGSAEIASQLNLQLREAGWQLVEASRTDPVAWSTWEITDEKGHKWGGVLLVSANAGTDHRFVRFEIEIKP